MWRRLDPRRHLSRHDAFRHGCSQLTAGSLGAFIISRRVAADLGVEVMMAQLPEPWLRGPLPGISPALQPVGHALVGAREDVHRATEALTPAQLWLQPGGAASIGFHLLHLAGSTDRLCTYARGATLSEVQRQGLAAEGTVPEPAPSLDSLLAGWRATVDRALDQLAQTPDAMLGDGRLVGRAQLPSTVRGLLFHAAEHAQRHTGQVITTAKIIRALG